MFIVRQSNHIQEDIKRNWSSWNFGQEGLECSEEELQNAISECLENGIPLCVSGFELYGSDLENANIQELYPNYWVLVDETKGSGLSCNILNASSVEEAIQLINSKDFRIEMGEGDMICCENAKVIYSNNDIHILELL